MASSNNQPSSAGQGFGLDTGFIERTYTACADDMGGTANNTVASGDMCWGPSSGLTMSLGGHSGELIQDPSNPNRYHLRHDDGTYVSLKTGASNGDNNGEYWVVTTTSGVQYWFGRNTSSNNSAWTEPVYGNNPGEPCHASTFAASSCAQAWRWNLDHVVDPSGNTMDFYYTTETNMYAADDDVNNPVSYIRGGFLNKITYGTRTGSTGQPPMQVVFTRGDRCVTSSCGTHDGVNWPDTPWDMQCTAAPCLVGSPTFWNTDALATISTQLYSGTGTSYNTGDDVDAHPHDAGPRRRHGPCTVAVQHRADRSARDPVGLAARRSPLLLCSSTTGWTPRAGPAADELDADGHDHDRDRLADPGHLQPVYLRGRHGQHAGPGEPPEQQPDLLSR